MATNMPISYDLQLTWKTLLFDTLIRALTTQDKKFRIKKYTSTITLFSTFLTDNVEKLVPENFEILLSHSRY